jgi:hypothetical protein
MELIGLRTPTARHIENHVDRLAVKLAREWGTVSPLCRIYLDPKTTKRAVLERFSPAVICPDCIRVARQWYAACYFVPFDSVQRRRLLDAVGWDLEAAG